VQEDRAGTFCAQVGLPVTRLCKLRAMAHPGYPRELNSKTGQLPGAVTKKTPNRFVEVRRKKALSAMHREGSRCSGSRLG
jgi:hypothetical protein